MFQILAAIVLSSQVVIYAPRDADGNRTTVTFDTLAACEEFVANDETFKDNLAKFEAQVPGPIVISCQDMTPEPKEEGSPH